MNEQPESFDEELASPPLKIKTSNAIPLRSALIILPLIGALIWSFFPACKALTGAFMLQREKYIKHISEYDNPTIYQRKIQKHFLKYGIYIPMDDIVIDNQVGKIDETLFFLMRKSCGRGKLYIWVPLKIRIPIIGEKVVEWCLKEK